MNAKERSYLCYLCCVVIILETVVGRGGACGDPGARRDEVAGPFPATKSNAAFAPGATYDTLRSGLIIPVNEKIPKMPLYIIGPSFPIKRSTAVSRIIMRDDTDGP